MQMIRIELITSRGLKGLRKDYSCFKPICSKMDLSIPSWTVAMASFTQHLPFYVPLPTHSKVASVKRVVVTSSIAAVNCNRKDQGPNVVVDETWFSDSDFCKETEKWYWLAKTLAEEAAWKYAQEHGMNLVALNPGFVVGPLLHPTLNTSSHLILHILRDTFWSSSKAQFSTDIAEAFPFSQPSDHKGSNIPRIEEESRKFGHQIHASGGESQGYCSEFDAEKLPQVLKGRL
ncbi:UNVERIFIED_CONTAM: Cinnamoyl-CoA reductase 1 [Sesamum calycinum]|uniref:Cinnamoyl-CoA reductase 1 n=1 Tax=Sesamum calycinum TaxID=2727403 RepID=A0AAW2RAC2_9LAMI